MSATGNHRKEVLRLAHEYAQALVDSAAHPSQAKAIIDRALAAGVSIRTVHVEVIPEALYEVGRRWQRAEISVAAEHLATAEAQDVLRDLARRQPAIEPNGRTAIVAAVEGELHELGPRVLADLLIGDGWQVFYVGAASPTDALVRLVEERRPDVVALSATLSTQLATLADAAARIRAIRPSPPYVLAGGQAGAGVPDIARKLGVDAYEGRADLAVERLRRIGVERDRGVAVQTLTPREREVLDLLADGLTNAEIAERLRTSVSTAKTHVENILRKLQLRNRAEAAAFVARRQPSA